MRLADQNPWKNRTEQPPHAVLDAWPLPAQAAVPEADEPLERAAEGDDEPITEKVPAHSETAPDRS